MLPLHRKTLPGNASELAAALDESIGRIFGGITAPVSIKASAYPKISALNILLDGATLRENPPRPGAISGSASPALAIETFAIQGEGISLGPAAIDLKVSARNVRLGALRDAQDDFVLVLQNAADGHIEISAATAGIERAISEVAKTEAGKHGVAIDQVQLRVNARGERGLDAEVKLRARKLFLSTTLQVSAQLDLDAELNATVSEVRCRGEGAMGSMACGFLEPHLQKINGRSVSLLALPLGEVRLRDVRISANERLMVRAEFGG